MIKFEESRMEFTLTDDRVSCIKFDETTFFEKHFKKLQGSKGIDFLVQDENKGEFYLIEVKNFRGSEHEPETKKRLQVGKPESVTFETALKVRDTIACIVGAYRSIQEQNITAFNQILTDGASIKVILLLEAPASKIQDFKRWTDDLKKQLAWLNVKVFVLNKDRLQQQLQWFEINNLPDAAT